MSVEHVLQAEQYYGKGLDHLFPEGALITSAPWPMAHRDKGRPDYDQERVNHALRTPPRLQEVDPRDLRSTQRSVTRAGVHYYTGSEYHETGRTFESTADPSRNPEGNRFPLIYRREASPTSYDPEPQNMILSGHHRAAAALVKGEPLRAIIVEGPWGEKR